MSMQHAVRSLGRAIALGDSVIISDSEYLRRYLDSRDPDSFRQLLERHGPTVKAVCRRASGDGHLAEDVFQATFLKLAQNAGRIRKPESLSGLLYKVAHNCGLKARKNRSTVVAAVTERVDSSADALDQITGRELLDLIDAELVRLPETYRSAVIVCTIEGHTLEEAAVRLNATSGAVRGWLQRGREQLRKRLTVRGVEFSIAITAISAASANRLSAVEVDATISLVTGASKAAPTAVATLLAGRAKSFWYATAAFVTAGIVGSGMLAVSQAKSDPPAEATVPVSFATAPIPKATDTEPPLPIGAVARFGSTRMRTETRSEWLGFSQDNKFLYSTSGREDRKNRSGVEVWDLSTGRKVNSIRYGEITEGASLNTDGKTMMLFVTDSGRNPDLGTPPDLPKMGPQYSQIVAHRIDMTTGSILSTARMERNACIFLGDNQAISHDGSRLSTFAPGRDERTVYVFSTDNGKQLCAIKRREQAKVICRCLSFTPDGNQIVFVDRGDANGPGKNCVIHFHDSKSGALIRQIPTEAEYISDLSFSSDGKRMAYSHRSKTGPVVTIHDLNSIEGRIYKSYPTQNRGSGALLSPVGKSVIAWAANHCLALDVETGKELFRTPNSFNPAPPTISSDGTLFATSHFGPIGIWNMKTGKALPISADPFDPDTALAFTAKESVRAINDPILDRDLKTGKETRIAWPVEGIRAGSREDISADGSLAVWWSQAKDESKPIDDTIKIINLDSGKTLSQVSFPRRSVCTTRFTHDNRHFYVCTADEKAKSFPIHRIDVATGKTDLTLNGHTNRIYAFDVSRDGQYVAAASPHDYVTGSDEFIRIWDTKTQNVIHQIQLVTADTELRKQSKHYRQQNKPGKNSRCDYLAFTPDGRLLAKTWSFWRDLVFFNPKTGAELDRITFNGEQIEKLALSEDGKKLYFREEQPFAGGSAVKVLDLESKMETKLLIGRAAELRSLLPSPDGQWLATVGSEGSYLWDLKKLPARNVEP